MLAVLVIFCWVRHMPPGTPMMSFYTVDTDFSNPGRMTFWTTNRTDKEIYHGGLGILEVRTANGWKTMGDIPVEGNSNLGPHKEGSFWIPRPGFSVGTVWRLKLFVARPMYGTEDPVALVKAVIPRIRWRLAGDTNTPVTPFEKGFAYNGPHSPVYSEPVTQH